jgi:hypothetical protein
VNWKLFLKIDRSGAGIGNYCRHIIKEAMKEETLNGKVSAAFMEFESLEHIHPSEAWRQSLEIRMASSKTGTSPGITGMKYIFIVTIFILANLGFIIRILKHDAQKSAFRNSELQVISREFLINPTSQSQ